MALDKATEEKLELDKVKAERDSLKQKYVELISTIGGLGLDLQINAKQKLTELEKIAG